MKATHKRFAKYLAAGLGASAAAAGQCDAQTIVTLYGPGAQSPLTNPATPDGIQIGRVFSWQVDVYQSVASRFAYSGGLYFTRGEDLIIDTYSSAGYYNTSDNFVAGAQAGDQNFANISFNSGFDPNNPVFEAVGQFYFDGLGGGYLVAIARNEDNTALSISAGKAAIEAIPEPSSIALLALGAAGVLAARAARRRREAAL